MFKKFTNFFKGKKAATTADDVEEIIIDDSAPQTESTHNSEAKRSLVDRLVKYQSPDGKVTDDWRVGFVSDGQVYLIRENERGLAESVSVSSGDFIKLNDPEVVMPVGSDVTETLSELTRVMDITVDPDDLLLSREEVIGKYKDMMARGEITTEEVVEYAKFWNLHSKIWRQRINDIAGWEYDEELISTIPPILHSKLALEQIVRGNTWKVLGNFELYHGIKDSTPFLELLSKTEDGLKALAAYIRKLPGTFGLDLANSLLQLREYDNVGKQIDKFDSSVHREIAQVFIDNAQTYLLTANLKGFKNLSDEQAKILIEAGYLKEVGENIKSFSGLTSETMSLIGADVVNSGIYSSLDAVASINSKTAADLVRAGGVAEVIEHIDKVETVDEELIGEIVKSDQLEEFLKNLSKVKFDHLLLAKKILDEKKGELLIRYIRNFTQISKKDLDFLADSLGSSLALHINKIENFISIELAKRSGKMRKRRV